ncbi:hypothetical protein B0H14DRAFT_3749285 [Mycena olivaceomarginata]|nr:hypothetical protein B0H14DRAFT_3749285 [Mycena olivaceomarginata]
MRSSNNDYPPFSFGENVNLRRWYYRNAASCFRISDERRFMSAFLTPQALSMSDLKTQPMLVHIPDAYTTELAYFAVWNDEKEILIEPRQGMTARCQREAHFTLPECHRRHRALPRPAQRRISICGPVFSPDAPVQGEFRQRTRNQTVGHHENMVVDGITSDPGAKYAITIRNNSLKPISPYFSISTRMSEWYAPGRSLALKNGESKTIGSGIEQTFEFVLLPGQTDRSGFLKLFVASEYVYPEWEQKSPFAPVCKHSGITACVRWINSHSEIDRTRFFVSL